VKDLSLWWTNNPKALFYYYIFFQPLKTLTLQFISLLIIIFKLIELNNSLSERYSFITTSIRPCTCDFIPSEAFKAFIKGSSDALKHEEEYLYEEGWTNLGKEEKDKEPERFGVASSP